MGEFISKHRIAFVLLVLFISAFGAFRSVNTSITLYPLVEKPTVRARVFFNFDVFEFKSLWGEKIESSLLSIEGVELVISEYSNDRVTFLIYFDWNSKNEVALREVNSTISNFSAQLPRDFKAPQVGIYNPGTECYLVVKPKKGIEKELGEKLKATLGVKLNEIPGISNYWISSTKDEDVTISIDPLLLVQHNLSITEVISALNYRLYDKAVGVQQVNPKQKIHVRLANGIKTIDDIKDIIVSQSFDESVSISDIATVSYKKEKVSRELLLDGTEAVAVAAWPDPDANLYDVAEQFFRIAFETLPDDMEIVVLNNPANFIKQALNKVFFSVILAIFSAGILVFIFLKSVKKTILAVAVMPLSIFGSVIIMELSGITINLLSVGAMSISVGMVIDGAIVVIDRLTNVETTQNYTPAQAVSEVAPAIFTSVLTTIIVFLPLAFTAPMASALLTDISIVIVSLMVFSLITSIVLLPAVWPSVFNIRKVDAQTKFFRSKSRKTRNILFEKIYTRTLRSLLEKKCFQVVSLTICIGVCICAYLSVFNTKIEIVAEPLPEIIDLAIHYKNPGLNARERAKLSEDLRNRVDNTYGERLKYIYSDVRETVAYLSLHLKRYDDAELLQAELEGSIKETEDYYISIDPWVTSSLKIPNPPDIQVLVSGLHDDERRKIVENISQALSEFPAIVRVKTMPKNQKIDADVIHIDRRSLSYINPNSDIDSIIESIFLYAGAYTERKFVVNSEINNRQSDIYYEVKNSDFKNVSSLPFAQHNELFHLGDFFEVSREKRWKNYFHRNGIPVYEVSFWLKNNAASNVREIKERIRKSLTKQESEMISYVDSRKEINEGLVSLVLAFLFSFALVFLVLMFMFSNFLYPVVISLSIPVGVLGALTCLYIFNSTISLNSLIGIVMLCGMAVNNGILYINEYILKFRTHKNIKESIIDSANSRIQTISITSLTSIVGLIPIIIGLGSGGKILQPLGISLAGGLIISTLFSIYIIPLLIYKISIIKQEKMSSSL